MEKPTVLVVLEGGLVSSILCTHRLDVVVDIFDFDCVEYTEDRYLQAHLDAGTVKRVGGEIEVDRSVFRYELTATGTKEVGQGE